MNTNSQITVGADPECFLIDGAGKLISSIDRIGGSKEKPLPIDDEGCAIQEDNVAVEYNIPPCKNAAEFIHYNKKVLAHIAERAREMGLGLSVQASGRFDEDQLMASPKAMEFGCEPDFNAWDGGNQNPRPRSEDFQLRSAGGHIHIGNIKGMDILAVVKAMDLFVGCQMLTFDKDTRRRELYGKAGAFRPKKYGVEYRTASNAWIASDELIAWAFNQTEKAVEYVRHYGDAALNEYGKMIQDCINNSDTEILSQLNEIFGM